MLYRLTGNDQFASIKRYADLGASKLVAESIYTYDDQARLIDLAHKQNANTLAQYGWTFDESNRITRFTSLLDGVSDYLYDDAGQLIAADHDYQTDESYTYDDNGNRISATNDAGTGAYTTGDQNRLETDGVFTYEYDAEGNRTRRVRISSDPADDFETLYGWDALNRLAAVMHKNNSGTETSRVEYVYDVFNRMIQREVFELGSSTAAETQQFVFDGDGTEIVLILNETGDISHRQLRGPLVDQILAEETNGATTWTLADHLNTFRDLAQYDDQTDTTSVINHRSFDSYGNLTAETSPTAIGFDHGFTGAFIDPLTNHAYRHNRWYDLSTGIWVSVDPKGFAAGDSNLYRYVGNDPVNRTDPEGLDWRDYLDAEKNGLNRFLRSIDPLRAYVNWEKQYVREHGETVEEFRINNELLQGMWLSDARSLGLPNFSPEWVDALETVRREQLSQTREGLVQIAREDTASEIRLIVADFTTGFIPGVNDLRDGYEVYWGEDLIWKNSISGDERYFTFKAMLLPVVSRQEVHATEESLTLLLRESVGRRQEAVKYVESQRRVLNRGPAYVNNSNYHAGYERVFGLGSAPKGVQANKAAGDAWEAEILNNQLPKTQTQIQRQITIKSGGPSGKKVRLDAVGTDSATGGIKLTDGKASATAPHTPNQKVVYPELEVHGGTVVGKGKPPYVGKTQIPPTKVDIIRKP